MAGLGDNVIVKILRRIGGVVRQASSYKVGAKSKSDTSDRQRPESMAACCRPQVGIELAKLPASGAGNCVATKRNCPPDSTFDTTAVEPCTSNQPTCRTH